MREFDLDRLVLSDGAHPDRDGMCVMEAVAWVAGEEWSKVDELRDLVEAAGRLAGELAGMEIGAGDIVDEVRRVAADLGDYVVASVVWSDGVVYEWAAGDVLIGRRAGTVEDAERVAALHGVLLEVV